VNNKSESIFNLKYDFVVQIRGKQIGNTINLTPYCTKHDNRSNTLVLFDFIVLKGIVEYVPTVEL